MCLPAPQQLPQHLTYPDNLLPVSVGSFSSHEEKALRFSTLSSLQSAKILHETQHHHNSECGSPSASTGLCMEPQHLPKGSPDAHGAPEVSGAPVIPTQL